MEREIKPREREKEEEKREGGAGRIRKEREDFGRIRKKGFLKKEEGSEKKRTYRKHPKERENFSEKEKSPEEKEKTIRKHLRKKGFLKGRKLGKKESLSEASERKGKLF